MSILLRSATIQDVPFVAWTIVTAVGISQADEALLKQVATICSREDVLYSWINCIIAEFDGHAAGGLCCYDGKRYQEMRRITFPIIAQHTGKDFSEMDLETVPGEYYLDSMAVLPEYRHRGVATALLNEGIRQAAELGINRASMIVSLENPAAQRLYESLGFRHKGDLSAFGEPYRKMIMEI
ncbi:MAG: GNAT family N-acetyltransferase [Bacteroidales bacterium]|nr:GNAT family N-acetyltransferase [Bacteroidales bacterium]